MRNPSTASSAATTTSKTTTPCCSKVGLKRGPWTAEEDELLSNYIKKEGEGRWRTLPKRAGLLRCGKSCRLRWMNYLRPSVKRGQIAADEEDLILRLHRLLGNRWSLIAGRIPGRTDNEIKNYWNTHLSKKLISQGIDPRTHKPLKPSVASSSEAAGDHHHGSKASSSTRKHPVSSPVPNDDPSPSSSLEDVISGGSIQIIGQNGFREENTSLINHYGCLNIITGSAAELIGNGEDHENMNYCTEDVFSSFLNSLINEDVYGSSQNQHQLLQMHQPNGMISEPTNVSDANIGFGTGIGGGAWADSTLLPSSENPQD